MKGSTRHSGEREAWSSRAGFLIATLGCAVGVGNIWRFAWAAKYQFDYASGSLGSAAQEDFAQRFSVFVSSPARPIAWQAIFLGAAVAWTG